MDAQAPVEIATTQTALNTWVWQTTGDWRLEPGPHRVTLSRTYGTDPHRSIFIDAVVLSADPAFDPNSHFPWTVALDTGQQPAIKSYTLPQGLPPGQYRWRVEVYDDERLVNGLGQPGVSTPSREFSVTADGAPSG